VSPTTPKTSREMEPPLFVTLPLIGPVLVVHATLELALLLLLLPVVPLEPLLFELPLLPGPLPLLEVLLLLVLEWEDVVSDSVSRDELHPTAVSDNEIAAAPAETVSATANLATRSQAMLHSLPRRSEL
jgi:hypothetical protein